MKFLRYIFIFVVVSCGGGGSSTNNQNCDNLPDPSIGRFLIDYIEIKSID